MTTKPKPKPKPVKAVKAWALMSHEEEGIIDADFIEKKRSKISLYNKGLYYYIPVLITPIPAAKKVKQ